MSDNPYESIPEWELAKRAESMPDHPAEPFEDDDDPYPWPDCPVCDGVGGYIGWLGKLAWFRCIFCGIEFSIDKALIGLVDFTEGQDV